VFLKHIISWQKGGSHKLNRKCFLFCKIKTKNIFYGEPFNYKYNSLAIKLLTTTKRSWKFNKMQLTLIIQIKLYGHQVLNNAKKVLKGYWLLNMWSINKVLHPLQWDHHDNDYGTSIICNNEIMVKYFT
jgi:hypothetical protein